MDAVPGDGASCRLSDPTMFLDFSTRWWLLELRFRYMSPGSEWEKRGPLEDMHVTYPIHPLSSISNNTSFLCIHQGAAIIFSTWYMKVLFVMVDIRQLRMCSSQALSLISWMINQAIFPSMFFCFCFVLFYFVLFCFCSWSRTLVEKKAVVLISWQNGKKQRSV